MPIIFNRPPILPPIPPDTNFANTNLTFPANRYHSGNQKNLSFGYFNQILQEVRPVNNSQSTFLALEKNFLQWGTGGFGSSDNETAYLGSWYRHDFLAKKRDDSIGCHLQIDATTGVKVGGLPIVGLEPAKFSLEKLQAFANNADAIAAGLPVDRVYKDPAGILRIVQ